MGGTELTSYCLAFAGLVLVAASMIAILRRSIHVATAHKMIVALATEGDTGKLVEVCALAPMTYLSAIRSAAMATDPPTAFDAAAARLDSEWRQIADRGMTGAALAIIAAIIMWHADLSLWPIWVMAIASTASGAYMLLRRGSVSAALDLARVEVLPMLGAVPKLPKVAKEPVTGVTKAPASVFAMLTKGKLPFATVRKPSLRDGTCPLCDHATVLTVDRKDTRFKSYVCAACGYAQDFADLAKL